MRTRHVLMLAGLLAAPLAAQEGDPDRAAQGSGNLPSGWMGRLDNANSSMMAVKFEDMAPGWHMTLGPAGIFYRATDRAAGPFHAVSKIHLFPYTGHAEGFGLFIGGQNLAAASQSYTYFLIRGDGKFLVKRRTGGTTTTVVPWTDHAAIKTVSAEGSVANELSVEVKGDSVSFMVNGQPVHSAAATQVDTRGIVGLRVNHNLNLHVESLAVHPR